MIWESYFGDEGYKEKLIVMILLMLSMWQIFLQRKNILYFGKKLDFWHHFIMLVICKNLKNGNCFLPLKRQNILLDMADNISSMERIDEEYLEPSREEYIKNAGLRTVFENIFAEKQLKNKRSYFPQTLQETSFEITDKGTNFEGAQFDAKIIGGVDDGRVRKGFQLLADQFTKKLEKIALEFPNPAPKDIKKLIYVIDSLAQNYFTFVPSDAYKSIGDISLYDHTKTTVAIASVLYLSGYHKESYKWEQGQTPTQKVGRETICVIAGDFPSIQKYLFSSLKSQKHLAKRLRMRSMNVQLLNEAVIEYLLDRLGLSRANVLMNA